MKILYTPTIVDGKQGLPDNIIKYGIYFEKGESVDVSVYEADIVAKLLTCPYFSEVIPQIEQVKVSPKKKAAKKK